MPVILAVVLLCGPLMILTGLGARRRGQALAPAAVAGLYFPVTWIVWYVRDEDPYRRTHHQNI